MMLTTAKQKFLDRTSSSTFEERLRDCLRSSAREHGKDFEDLDLRFAVVQPAAFFVGPGRPVRSPQVRSIEELGSLRKSLAPFRRYSITQQHMKSHIYWFFSPRHLEDAWERFQNTVAEMWTDSSYLERIRISRQASTASRQRMLQWWEREHMALQDEGRHRPKYLRDKRTQLQKQERLERLQMAKADKNQHRPRRLRVYTAEETAARNLAIQYSFI